MKARFLHIADCHLGYRQYNNSVRYDDFAKAFLYLINVAIQKKVDFVILAGDLFQKRAIDALTLNQAMVGLERLQSADIPCIAVEGNHELAYYEDVIGWMRFLAHRKLLVLLDSEFHDGTPQLTPYDGRNGAYYDPFPWLRIYGISYRGASTARAIAGYANSMGLLDHEQIHYRIMIAHTGIEGVLSGESGGLSHRQVSVLRPHIDYFALGHIHKPFEFDHWIYNPGSPETCSMIEASWPERGYYLVEIDTDESGQSVESIDKSGLPARHTSTLHSNPRRSFYRFRIQVDLHESPEALYDYCRSYIERRARDLNIDQQDEVDAPVVDLQLTGVMAFDRSDLDLSILIEIVEDLFQPLHIQVRNLSQPTDFAIEQLEGISRPELERKVLSELFERDARFREQSQDWTQLALSLKHLALSGGTVDIIREELAERMEKIAPVKC
ncbi:exonuclease SbcCD subunit D [Chloroflexi bacterium TSY]|nr:exonuclease SbcCD subunit D [Chloroflexi bacterium TSY]